MAMPLGRSCTCTLVPCCSGKHNAEQLSALYFSLKGTDAQITMREMIKIVRRSENLDIEAGAGPALAHAALSLLRGKVPAERQAALLDVLRQVPGWEALHDGMNVKYCIAEVKDGSVRYAAGPVSVTLPGSLGCVGGSVTEPSLVETLVQVSFCMCRKLRSLPSRPPDLSLQHVCPLPDSHACRKHQLVRGSPEVTMTETTTTLTSHTFRSPDRLCCSGQRRARP